MKNEIIESFPLHWPLGQKRTPYPEKARFKTNFSTAYKELLRELKLMGAENFIFSSNIPLKKDGNPYAIYKLNDPGVAIYFDYKGKKMVFACDKWDSVEMNIQALNKTINAIRGIERWGSSEMMERAFSGLAQLPEYKKYPSEWYEILEVHKDCKDFELIKAKRNFLAKKYHEDGESPDHDKMVEINRAFEYARELSAGWALGL